MSVPTPHDSNILPMRPATTDAASSRLGLREVPAFPPSRANATEVNAVAHLVETFAPEVTVRTVSRKRDVYVVGAVVSRRRRTYRIPLDMIPAAATQHGTLEIRRAA